MACSTKLYGITDICSKSKGGIRKVYIAPYVDGAYSVAKTEDIDGKVTAITETVKWLEVAFRKNTGSVTSTLNIDNTAGVNYVSSEITLVFTRQETAKRIAVASMAVGQMLVVVEDANGLRWVYGMDTPVEASAGTAATGTNATDGNNYTITLSDESESFPYELDESVVLNVE